MKGFTATAIPVVTNKASAVTAVKAGANGKIYAGLTAKTHVLVEIDPRTNEVRDCGPMYKIEGDYEGTLDKIHNSLCADPDGRLWIGQGLNIADGWPPDFDFTKFPGGHLYCYDPATGDIQDHGIPVPMSSIHAMTIAPEQGMIYGHVIPDHHFWSYNIATGEMKDWGRIGPYPSTHNLQTDRDGNCWGAWRTIGDAAGVAKFYVMKFDLCAGKLIRTMTPVVREALPMADPYNWGIDGLCLASDGMLYGGEAGLGMMFRLDPADGSVEYLGKPLAIHRMTGLVEGPDGLIYMTAGYPVMRLLSYCPRSDRFTDYGPIADEYEICYFHGIDVSPDGVIWTAETDSNRCIVYKCVPSA